MTGKATLGIKSYVETDPEYPGTFELILSDSTLDRDGEIVDAKCFSASRSLPERISMDTDHALTVESTVGSGVPSYTTDGRLAVAGQWAATEKAQTTRSLVRDGHIMFASVAYKTLKTKTDQKTGVRHIVDAELLNGTFTQIPANPNAKVISAKVGARNSKSDAEQIQAAHDAMVAVGASCSTSNAKAFRPNGRKAIVGSVEALQARCADALEDAYCEDGESSDMGGMSAMSAMVCLRGVLPDRVIFQCYGCADLESDETYSQTYTDDGAVVTLTGAPVIVDIAEIVTPDADADEAVDAVGKAVSAAFPSAEAAALLVRARMARIHATATFV